YIYVPTKKGIGEACGLQVGAAAAAITDPGQGKDILDEVIKRVSELIGKS
ncbi:MAG: 50S ribosomal protein L7ae, partial [Metallosphaera sp.]